MSNVSTHITAAIAAILIATGSIAGIVHLPQADGAQIAAAGMATLA